MRQMAESSRYVHYNFITILRQESQSSDYGWRTTPDSGLVRGSGPLLFALFVGCLLAFWWFRGNAKHCKRLPQADAFLLLITRLPFSGRSLLSYVQCACEMRNRHYLREIQGSSFHAIDEALGSRSDC